MVSKRSGNVVRCADRSLDARAQAADVPDLTTLFADPVAEGIRRTRKTGMPSGEPPATCSNRA